MGISIIGLVGGNGGKMVCSVDVDYCLVVEIISIYRV